MDCSICAGTTDSPETTTLDCGHTFHVSCALQWFRYHNTTCPLCRSEYLAHPMATMPPEKRVTAMRRRRRRLSPVLQKQLRALDRVKATKKQVHTDRVKFRRMHDDVFRTYRRMWERENRLMTRETEMTDTLSKACSPVIPFLIPEEEEDGSENWEVESDVSR